LGRFGVGIQAGLKEITHNSSRYQAKKNRTRNALVSARYSPYHSLYRPHLGRNLEKYVVEKLLPLQISPYNPRYSKITSKLKKIETRNLEYLTWRIKGT
jgi:hypothetical protein